MIVISLLAAIIAGGALGVGMAFADSQGFYLVLVMPLIAGFLIGFVTYLPVIRQEVSSAPLVIAAIIGGLIAVGAYWYGLYTFSVNDVVASIQEDAPDATREEVITFLDEGFEREFGQTGIVGFVMAYADAGFTVTRSFGSSDSSGLDIQGNVAYGFWALEALLLIGSAVIGVLRRKSTALYKRSQPSAPAV